MARILTLLIVGFILCACTSFQKTSRLNAEQPLIPMFVGSVSYYHPNEDTLRKFLEANDGAVVYIHMEIDADSVMPEVDGRELETCPPSESDFQYLPSRSDAASSATGKIPVACELAIRFVNFTPDVHHSGSYYRLNISDFFRVRPVSYYNAPAARSVYELEHQGSDMVTRAKYRRMAISKSSH